ncbi:hypothetical protein C1S81_14855 [Mycolicibacterium neoaurum]|nr:hypothetical protein C1S81_14855 [Mycolicibacterium neoaurum]
MQDGFFVDPFSDDLGLHQALAQDQDSVTELGEFREIRRHDDHTHAGVGQRTNRIVNLVSGVHIDALSGFVEQQHLRCGARPASDDRLLLIATAEQGEALVRVCGPHVIVGQQAHCSVAFGAPIDTKR